MLGDVTLLTKNDRKELKKLIKLSKKDKFNKIKFSEDIDNNLNYYQIDLVNFRLIKTSRYYPQGKVPKFLDKDEDGYLLASNSIEITDDGYHYFEKYHEHLKNIILKSAITPIVVSVVTTLITIGAKQLLQLILK